MKDILVILYCNGTSLNLTISSAPVMKRQCSQGYRYLNQRFRAFGGIFREITCSDKLRHLSSNDSGIAVI